MEVEDIDPVAVASPEPVDCMQLGWKQVGRLTDGGMLILTRVYQSKLIE